jgi:hypothetical protein
VKKPDFLILIAVWQFITAFIALIGICAIAVFVFPDAVGPLWGQALAGVIFGLTIAILVLLVYIGIAIAGGIGLLRGHEWGRVLSIVHAALSLFSFPIGTTIGILIIVYLTKSDVSEYFKAGIEKKK